MMEIKDLMNIVERGFNAGEIESQITEEESKESKQQILQDHGKARKWDESLLGAFLERDMITVGDYMQNIKLRELIEKEIESGQDGRLQSSLLFLQHFIEDSKK